MADPRDMSDDDALASLGHGSAARQRVLEHRLDDGYRRIDQAAMVGADVSEWESFWIRLLGEYEDICRESDLAA